MSRMIYEGVRILDFTQVISGSYGTTLLADLGAEVIKVEPPFHGDSLRFAGPMHHGESGFFLLNNRNKKSISVDLKVPEGVALVKELVPHCIIVIENFKPGVMQKLGLGYDDLRKLKNDLIYVSVSGYGYNNRYSNQPAYDNIIQSETGLATQNGLPGNGGPLRSPLSVSDYAAGIYGGFAMASALLHHRNTGQGQYIDIAMYDALISIMDNTFLICDINQDEIKKAKAEGRDPLGKLGLKSSGNRHAGASPHGYYKTRDGYVAHMSLSNQMWHRLLKIIGREELIGRPEYESLDERKSRWREIDGMVEEWSTRHATDEVIRILSENNLPCGRARTVDEVYADPHNQDRGIFQKVEHPVAGKVNITNIPIKFSETPSQIRKPSPILGADCHDVLTGILGYSREQVDRLLEKKILFRKS